MCQTLSRSGMKLMWLSLSLILCLAFSGCLRKPAKPNLTAASSKEERTDIEAGEAINGKASDDEGDGLEGDEGTEGSSADDPAAPVPRPDDLKPPQPVKGNQTPKAPTLQQSPRFDELTFLTAHNAFVNSGDATWAAPNQSRSLQFQLDNGVTAFMLDIWPSDKNKQSGRAVLCHGSCFSPPQGILKVEVEVPGIFFAMSLEDYLRRIGGYLDAHRDAILTVFFEDYVNHDQLRDALNAAPAFRDRIFDPYKWEVMEKGWPRIDALIKDNKRLFVVSDRSDKKDLGVAFAQDFTAENFWSLGKEGKDLVCKTRWNEKDQPLNRTHPKFTYLFVMNHFRDIPDFKFSQDDNKIDAIWNRINRECLPAAEKKPNFLAVDHFDEADWGARKVVAELNEIGVLLYRDGDFRGTLQMLKPGKYLTKDLTFGDNQITSLKVMAKTRVKLYEDDNFKKLLIELTEDSKNLGKLEDKTSSIVVVKE